MLIYEYSFCRPQSPGKDNSLQELQVLQDKPRALQALSVE